MRLLSGMNPSKLWLCAYGATLLLPWALIFSRALADASCVAIGLLFLWQCSTTNDWKWLKDPVAKAGLLAWGWLLLVVTPFSGDVMESFFTAAPWGRYILLYAALRHWVLLERPALFLLGKTLSAMLVFVCADTLWQYVSGTSLTGHVRDVHGRLSGPFTNIKVGIFLARMLLPAVALYLYFALLKKSRAHVAASFILLVAGIAVTLLSGERTAFLSTIIALAFLAVCLAIAEPHFRKTTLALFGGILVLSAALFYTQPWIQDRADDLYVKLSGYPSSNYGQLVKAGYLLGTEDWATGTGLKGFRALCPPLQEQHMVGHCNLHPHNPYVEWLAEAGVPGFLLFVALIGYMVAACVKPLKSERGIFRLLPAFALASLIANFFPFMPTQSFFSNWPGLVLWYCVSVSLASMNALRGFTERRQ